MEKTRAITVRNVSLANTAPLVLIAGPCVLEGREMALETAAELKRIAAQLHIPFIFKASYDKANRSSVRSYRGPGMKAGLSILSQIKRKLDVPVVTDIHSAAEAEPAAKVADMLQIPAFLCRQTDLLLAAAATGLAVNVKKGQFLAPEDMGNICGKIESAGNRNIILTERGTSFGYHNLVVDMRSLAIMKRTGYPVVFDATHSVQLPGGLGTATGGQREFVKPLAKAAAALGIAALFIEVHPDPSKALSDGPNSLPLKEVGSFLKDIVKIDHAVKA